VLFSWSRFTLISLNGLRVGEGSFVDESELPPFDPTVHPFFLVLFFPHRILVIPG